MPPAGLPCPAGAQGTRARLPQVEHVADPGRERRLRDRLLDQGDARIEATLVNDRVPGVAGHEQDLELRPPWPRAPGEIAPVEVRQDHVCEKKIDVRLAALQDG